MIRDRRLGRGLDVIIGGDEPSPVPLSPLPVSTAPAAALEIPSISPPSRPAGPYREIAVDRIDPNPFQPRSEFDETGLAELAGSIEKQGLFQPIVVRAKGDRYELIAGERRWRAFRRLSRERVPAIIRDLPDDRMLLAAILENLQRKDLNPIEKARAFKSLLTHAQRTQEEVASDLGIDRSTLANFIRLLELPEEVQDAVSRGTLTMGHARALLGAPSSQKRAQVFRLILTDQISVRQTERLLSPNSGKGPQQNRKASESVPWVEEIESKLRSLLGTKAKIHHDLKTKKGCIEIEYYGNEQLTEILKIFGIN